MTVFTRQRGYARAVVTPGTADYIAVPVITFSSTAATIRRITVDFDFALSSTTAASSTTYPVPSGVGLTFTTAPSGTAPAAPTQGPISNPNGTWWWWQGAPWRALYPSVSGGYLYAVDGRVDTETNRSVSSTEELTVWFVAEALDASTIFDGLFLVAYFNTLYD